jgi:hypothetical protein
MKRKILFFVTMLAVFSLVTLQSCDKDEIVQPTEYNSFTTPEAVSPEDGESVDITGTTVALTWASENADGTAISADVYFGTSEDPELYQAGVTGLTLTVPVVKGQTYYWYVVMRDVNNITTEGEIWHFTVFEPIGIFVGDFLCDEPAEAYSYDVAFAKTGDNTLLIDNYWNSGWEGTFTLDFTANTFSMPLTVWPGGEWSSIESGTIDPETGTMVGDYTVYRNGVSFEVGVHTYTKY